MNRDCTEAKTWVNEWRKFEIVTHVDESRPETDIHRTRQSWGIPNFTGVKTIIRHDETGRTAIESYPPIFTLTINFVPGVYKGFDRKANKSIHEGRISFPYEECSWMFHEKTFGALLFGLTKLQPGDFVKFSGTRANDWNRIDSISPVSGFAFGQKFREPKEGTHRYTSSENTLAKIQKVVRDGVQIFPE